MKIALGYGYRVEGDEKKAAVTRLTGLIEKSSGSSLRTQDLI
jgi:hypothetical protein